PASVIRPLSDAAMALMVPWKIGGPRVPITVVNPSATAMPSDSPRYRITKPNVRPPSPHIAPQNQHQNRIDPGTEPRTPSRSRVCSSANSQGAMTHENTPPVSQKISQDQ